MVILSKNICGEGHIRNHDYIYTALNFFPIPGWFKNHICKLYLVHPIQCIQLGNSSKQGRKNENKEKCSPQVVSEWTLRITHIYTTCAHHHNQRGHATQFCTTQDFGAIRSFGLSLNRNYLRMPAWCSMPARKKNTILSLSRHVIWVVPPNNHWSKSWYKKSITDSSLTLATNPLNDTKFQYHYGCIKEPRHCRKVPSLSVHVPYMCPVVIGRVCTSWLRITTVNFEPTRLLYT